MLSKYPSLGFNFHIHVGTTPPLGPRPAAEPSAPFAEPLAEPFAVVEAAEDADPAATVIRLRISREDWEASLTDSAMVVWLRSGRTRLGVVWPSRVAVSLFSVVFHKFSIGDWCQPDWWLARRINPGLRSCTPFVHVVSHWVNIFSFFKTFSIVSFCSFSCSW